MNAKLQAQQPASNIRVLVIDDEPRMLASLEALLNYKHYQVDTVLGGKLACQKLQQNQYDLVMLDLNMSDFDGFAVMAYMADHGINAATVVVSGEATFDAVRSALRMGASDYVKKPYSPEELFATIDSTLDKKHLRDNSLSAIVTDVSEDIAAKKMRHSHTLFQQAEAMGNMGHFCWDRKGHTMLSCSDQFARIYGMTVSEVLEFFINTEAAIDLIHPDDKERYRQVINDSNVRSNGFDVEYRIITSSGDTLYLYERSEVVLDNDGMPSHSFGTVQDITERKQTELREKSRTHILELITNGDPLRVILEAIVRVVEQQDPDMLCSVLLLDDAGKHLLSGAASSLPDFYNEAMHGIEIGMGVGSCGTAAFMNERVIVDDIQTHPYWVSYKELASNAKLGACWSEPIRSTKGEVLGTFAIYHHNLNYPTEADLAVIEQTASLASIAIEKRQAEGKLERIAHYDLLTDLPNRVLLADRLSQAMVQSQRRNQSLAVAYLDLDGFKAVNDTHGHDMGDKLLVALSKRMKETLREGDTLARIGGDEFIAVMVDLEKIEDSEPLLKRLLKAAADPVTVSDTVLQVSASIGLTLYPQDGVDADQLIRHADQAMYVAKQAGKNRYHLFDSAQDI